MNDLIPAANVELMASSGMPQLLQRIRPQWQAKSLIERVHRLVGVDPSSACQRLFNAAIHDLREKVIIAGLDIAGEAADQFRLPPVKKDEDIENYPTAKLIDLCYRMGLLTRPEWRRVCRSYEIRRDLEHEDDEYIAGVEDCVYIFTTCVEVILSVDPVNLLKVKDVKDIVENATPSQPGDELLADFERAPQPRQLEILGFLVSNALNKDQSDIIQQNAFTCLHAFRARASNQVLVTLATDFQEKVGRNGLDERHARVATAAGAMPYLRQSARKELFQAYLDRLNQIGTNWSAHDRHGDVLRKFDELGGFASCPNPPQKDILKWMVKTFLGSPGGLTSYGNVRHVFYSNSAAPLIETIIASEAKIIEEILRSLRNDDEVSKKCENEHIARRFEKLIDLIEKK
ncbi:MAG: hypothetical protein ACK5NN_00855 [Sphingomonadaceae bacterium]